MVSGELDNANPTIISVSELPSHRRRQKSKQDGNKGGIEELLMAKPSYAMDPFYMSDFSDTDSDDSTIEPIDEQEIYGEYCFKFPQVSMQELGLGYNTHREDGRRI